MEDEWKIVEDDGESVEYEWTCQIKAAILDFLLKDVYFVMYCRYDVTSKVIEKCENQIFRP